jgi:transmembrane sensor
MPVISAEETEKLAASWLARADRGLTDEEACALDAWLAQSSLNKVAYLRLKASWRRADRLAALKQPVARHDRVVRILQPKILAALAAALTLLLGGTGYLVWRAGADQVYATDIGKTQSVLLADGSRMELNTNTRVHADVTAARRIVTLDSGEAYFDVVHDASRPFTVLAANRRITDIGTKFSVLRNGNDVRVVVREGKVRVEVVDGQGGAPVLAQAGREVIAAGNESLVLGKPVREIENDLSWRAGMLVFDQETLAEAADQFNRYNSRHIQVEGNARKIRIGGRFKAGNVDVFVQLLHRGFGLSVSDEGDRIVVSR